MTFNISDFKANITGAGSRGVSKEAHYEIVMSLPRKIYLSDRSKRAYRDMRFRIQTAEIPGRTITASSQKTLGYGLPSKIGYDVTYGDVQISMLCGADLGEKSFFTAWQSSVIGNHTRNDDTRTHQSIGYYSDYVAPVGIIKYDDTGNAVYSIGLAEAFPIVVNSMPLSWSSDNMHVLNVTFAYKHFVESDEPSAGTGARKNTAGASLTINGLPNINDAFEGMGLPRIGEILNIPQFDTDTYTLTGASDISGVFT
jgi:hypothetical protein